jgi:RNA polymerase sigma-70 factor (ECF subfamily)
MDSPPDGHISPALMDQLLQSRRWLQRAASQRLRHPHGAEDAVSETLLAAMEKPPPFDDPQRVRAWLFGILRHKVVDQLRQAGRTVSDDDAQTSDTAAAPHANPADHACDKQFVVALDRALRTLPAAQARAFVLHDALGHAPPDVCADLGVTRGHLCVLLHRARRRLQVHLAAHRH